MGVLSPSDLTAAGTPGSESLGDSPSAVLIISSVQYKTSIHVHA